MPDAVVVHTDAPIVAALPARFGVTVILGVAIGPHGRLRLFYDYRGTRRQESLGQAVDPQAANYVRCQVTGGDPPAVRCYSATHSYKPPWTPEPECFTWIDLFGPDVSLNCHVAEATWGETGLDAGSPVTFEFGAGPAGFHLTRKSYRAYPFWAIVDEDGDGAWRAVGKGSVEVLPGPAIRVEVVAPSVVAVGETIVPHVQAFDAECNPVPFRPGSPSISTKAGTLGQAETGGPVLRAPGLAAGPEPGSLRFSQPGIVQPDPAGAGPLPIRCNPCLVAPEVPGQRIYWGDIHGHANVCDGGVRTPADYFAWARDVLSLDFCAITSHDFGIAPGGPDRWQELQRTANRANQRGAFATLVSWESSHIGAPAGRPAGHKNLYFRDDEVPFFNGSIYGGQRVRPDYRDYPELQKLLRDTPCLVVPHHPLKPVLPGGLGTNWNEFWPERERLVEVYSLWGCSESMDAPGRTTQAVDGTSILTALLRGYRLGFVAGSDTHDGRPGNPSEPWSHVGSAGLTAVYAPELTRTAVYDALWQRACYGTSGARIILYTETGGLPMGGTTLVGPNSELLLRRQLRLRAAGTSTIDRAEVIRNGELVHTFHAGAGTLEAEWTDTAPLPMIALADAAGRRFVFYYVRLFQDDGQRAWASPVWFDLDEIFDQSDRRLL